LGRFIAQYGDAMSPEMRAALQTLGVQTDAVPRQTQPAGWMQTQRKQKGQALVA